MKKFAGFWIRLGATTIDRLLIWTISIGIAEFFFQGNEKHILIILLDTAYYTIVPIIWNGYTIGKYFLGIRIQRVDGKKIDLTTMLLREVIGFFMYIASFLLLAIGSLLMILVREDKRTVHDFIAKTYVLYVNEGDNNK